MCTRCDLDLLGLIGLIVERESAQVKFGGGRVQRVKAKDPLDQSPQSGVLAKFGEMLGKGSPIAAGLESERILGVGSVFLNGLYEQRFPRKFTRRKIGHPLPVVHRDGAANLLDGLEELGGVVACFKVVRARVGFQKLEENLAQGRGRSRSAGGHFDPRGPSGPGRLIQVFLIASACGAEEPQLLGPVEA